MFDTTRYVGEKYYVSNLSLLHQVFGLKNHHLVYKQAIIYFTCVLWLLSVGLITTYAKWLTCNYSLTNNYERCKSWYS